MATDIKEGLAMHLLLSVRRGDDFPNIEFVRTTPYENLNDVSADNPLGQGFFKRISKATYDKSQKNLKAADIDNLTDNAAALTRSVAVLMAGIGTPVWDGSGPHPDTDDLGGAIDGLIPA